MPSKSQPQSLGIIFYDGNCGLCHGCVRFVLAQEDKTKPQKFQFSPLQAETFKKYSANQNLQTLPDSIVLYRQDGSLALRSEAVLEILKGLGGFWKILADIGRIFPRPLRDWLYDLVATYRRKIFSEPKQLCPIVPEDLRSRFI